MLLADPVDLWAEADLVDAEVVGADPRGGGVGADSRGSGVHG